MNLLVLCPHFAPDVAPTGDVMTQIVEQLDLLQAGVESEIERLHRGAAVA